MKVIVLIVIVVTIWQWNCISSLPTNNETVHHCPPEHHRDPENLERPRRNIFTKVSTSITKATKYVGKKLHIIKRDVSPVLDHNETHAESRNRTNEAVIRITRSETHAESRNRTNEAVIRSTRSETQTDNSTTTATHNDTITDQIDFQNVTDNNSTNVEKETVEPQRLTRQVHLKKFEEIEDYGAKLLNITSTNTEAPYNQSDVTKLPQGQANITFFIQFFENNDTNVLKDIKAETPIHHHHHHKNLTKRDANEDVTGKKKKRCCSRKIREAVRGTLVNRTHIEMKHQADIGKSVEKSTHMRKCTCIVTFGTQDPLLSETSVEANSEPLLADLICSNACSELTKIYYTTEQQKFCKRIDNILRTVLQAEKNVDVTRDLIYCQVLPEQEIPEQPVFPKISWTNVIILNLFACLVGLTFLLCIHLLCRLCFYAVRKQEEKWVKAGVTTKMGSIRIKQNKTGNVV